MDDSHTGQLLREGVQLGGNFNVEVCNGQSHQEFTIVIWNGQMLRLIAGANPAAGHIVQIEDPQHTEMFPIRYITFKSGPESDAYWLINTVDEPKTFRFPYKPTDDNECL